MSVHFFSVLGTGLYEPVIYHFSEKAPSSSEREFVQMALLDEFQDLLQDDGKISIFLTEGAKKRNWEDRLYTDKDVEFSDRWISKKKEERWNCWKRYQ